MTKLDLDELERVARENQSKELMSDAVSLYECKRRVTEFRNTFDPPIVLALIEMARLIVGAKEHES